MTEQLSIHDTGDAGSSLLELMTVILIIAILATIALPALQHQIANREIETIARRFISHAHFARAQALRLGDRIYISPLHENDWNDGWVVKSACNSRPCTEKFWLMQENIAPVLIKRGGKQFSGPHSQQRGILFNAAGAAKTQHGGFVANRLILSHLHHQELERHVILSSGGRWRICNPKTDAKSCK